MILYVKLKIVIVFKEILLSYKTIMSSTIRVNKSMGKVLDNICNQILHIKTPEDRLRACISNLMLIASFLNPKGETAKNGCYHIYHLLNVLTQDVNALQWSHPLEDMEEDKIYDSVSEQDESDSGSYSEAEDCSEAEIEDEEGEDYDSTTETETETEEEPEHTDTDTETDTDLTEDTISCHTEDFTDTDTETETESETDAEDETDTETDAEDETETDTESETNSESNSKEEQLPTNIEVNENQEEFVNVAPVQELTETLEKVTEEVEEKVE